MTERPILFSGPMIRALLAGWKTQTRRVVNPQPKGPFHSASGAWVDMDQENSTITEIRCRYGEPGDLLLVRETWQYADWTEDGYPYIRYRADDSKRLCERINDEWAERLTDIWAGLSDESNYSIDGRAADRRWRPAIHMPRWACRLTLRLTDVRVEQLMDISADDAEAEGWPHRNTGGAGAPLRDAYPIGWYANLWDDINGRGSWEQNPWVWALTFEVLKQDSSAAECRAHNPEVAGSNPAPASSATHQPGEKHG